MTWSGRRADASAAYHETPAELLSGLAPTPASTDGGREAQGSALSLSNRVATSALWAILGEGAGFLASFLATPFTIRLLGPARYGAWSILRSLITYFRLADLGMAATSTKSAAERHARGDEVGEATVVWSALALSVGLTGIAALVAGALAPFIISHLLHLDGSLHRDAVPAFRLICVAGVAYACAATLNTPQQVRLQWRSLTLATSGPAVLQTVLAPVVLAMTAGGLTAIAAVTAIGVVVAALGNLVVAARLQPRLRRPRVRTHELSAMVRYGGALAIVGIVDIPLLTAERFLLADFRAPTTVAYYAAAAGLASLLLVIPAAASQPLIPTLTRLISLNRLQEHASVYHQVGRVVFLAMTPACLVIAFLGRPFLGLWAGAVYGLHSAVPFYIITAGIWCNTLSYPPHMQLIAANGVRALAWIRVAELGPYLITAAILIAAFGAIGAAIAWTTRMLVDGVALSVLVRRRYGLVWRPAHGRLRATFLADFALGAVLLMFAALSPALYQRIPEALCAVAIYCYSGWRFLLTGSERSSLARLAAAAQLRVGRRHSTEPQS